MDYPRLRPLEVLPVPGAQTICLRDPLGFCEQPVLVGSAGIAFLQFFDGEHSIRDIQTAISRATGELILSEHIAAIIGQFDDLHLLDSDNFRAHRESVIRRYRDERVREAAHEGQAYPRHPEELRACLDSFYAVEGGAGVPPFSRAPDPVRAIVAPHIDLRSGGPCYTHAHRALFEGSRARTFVILGVAHAGAENIFAGTRKSFATPLGTLAVDEEFLDALSSQLCFDLCHDELAHRFEHSIEFQLVFLQHLMGNHVKIVPILVGGFHALIFNGMRPEDDDRIASFIAGLRNVLQQWGDDAAVIVSVDLAHVGMRFGDDGPLSSHILERVEREDREFLLAVESLDADQLLDTIARDNDARRVDGYPGIYTMLKAMPLREGKLLRYEQTANAEAQSVVSFASMAFR